MDSSFVVFLMVLVCRSNR